MSRIIDAPSELDWLEVCDLYQSIQDTSISEMLDSILAVAPEFPREFIAEMYQLSDDWSDFTPARPSDDCPF